MRTSLLASQQAAAVAWAGRMAGAACWPGDELLQLYRQYLLQQPPDPAAQDYAKHLNIELQSTVFQAAPQLDFRNSACFCAAGPGACCKRCHEICRSCSSWTGCKPAYFCLSKAAEVG